MQLVCLWRSCAAPYRCPRAAKGVPDWCGWLNSGMARVQDELTDWHGKANKGNLYASRLVLRVFWISTG